MPAIRAREVAVGLDPHPADGLPAPLFDPFLDGLEQLGIIVLDVLVELRLALGEVVLGELFHQPQDCMEGAPGLAARLAQRPEPGHVDVGVSGGEDIDIQRRSGRLDAGAERIMGGSDRIVEAVVEGFAGVERFECRVEGVQQVGACGACSCRVSGRCQALPAL